MQLMTRLSKTWGRTPPHLLPISGEVLSLAPCAEFKTFGLSALIERKIMKIPNTPSLAALPYSPAINKKIQELESLHSVWAEEDTLLAELQDKRERAIQDDMCSLRAAAISGEPIPKKLDVHEIEREIVYQTERVNYCLRQTEKAGRELKTLVLENKTEVIKQAIEKARNGIDTWREDISKIAQAQQAAYDSRNKSLDAIRMISNMGLTSDVIKFDPFFPTSGDFSVPNPTEAHLSRTLDGLEKLLIQ